jgi:hypothetical protein
MNRASSKEITARTGVFMFRLRSKAGSKVASSSFGLTNRMPPKTRNLIFLGVLVTSLIAFLYFVSRDSSGWDSNDYSTLKTYHADFTDKFRTIVSLIGIMHDYPPPFHSMPVSFVSCYIISYLYLYLSLSSSLLSFNIGLSSTDADVRKYAKHLFTGLIILVVFILRMKVKTYIRRGERHPAVNAAHDKDMARLKKEAMVDRMMKKVLKKESLIREEAKKDK